MKFRGGQDPKLLAARFFSARFTFFLVRTPLKMYAMSLSASEEKPKRAIKKGEENQEHTRTQD